MPTGRCLLQRVAIIVIVLALPMGACTSGRDDASSSTSSSVEVGETPGDVGAGPARDGGDEASDTVPPDPDGDTPDTTTAPPQLVVWADDLRANVLEEVAATFEEATGVTVVVERLDIDAIRAGLGDPSSATGGSGPDVFVGPSTWTGALVEDGHVAPIDLGPDRATLVGTAVDAFTYAGEVYGAPYAADALALYVNADLVDTPPATLDEMLDACAALGEEPSDREGEAGTEEANPFLGCWAVPGGGGEPDAYHHYPFLTAFGGGVFSFEPGQGFDITAPMLDTDEVVEGIDMVDDLADAGIIPSLTYDEARSAFVAGRIPFFLTGPWEVGPLSDEDLAWEVVPLPTVDDSRLRSPVTAQGLFIGGESANPVIAQTFITDFVLTAEILAALHAGEPRTSSLLSIVEQEADTPILSAFNQSVVDGDAFPNLAGLDPLWDELGRAMAEARGGEAVPDEVMSSALEVLEGIAAVQNPPGSGDG